MPLKRESGLSVPVFEEAERQKRNITCSLHNYGKDVPPTHSPNPTSEMPSTKQCQMDFPAKIPRNQVDKPRSPSRSYYTYASSSAFYSASPQSFLNTRTPSGLNASLLRPLTGNCFQETQMANKPEQGWDRKINWMRTHLGLHGARQGKHLQAVSDLTHLPKLSLFSGPAGRRWALSSPSFLSQRPHSS